MKKNLAMEPIKSSFLSCEKDFETILRRLFVESKPHNEELIRLLTINMPDCLTNRTSNIYKEKINNNSSLAALREAGYIRFSPEMKYSEHEEVKTYIIMSIDNFTPNTENPQFRDCVVHFDIICHTDCWEMDDYCVRPLKVAGYIDGILNNSKLSGIGTFQFMGCSKMLIGPGLAGYAVLYKAIHGGEDTHEGDVLNG